MRKGWNFGKLEGNLYQGFGTDWQRTPAESRESYAQILQKLHLWRPICLCCSELRHLATAKWIWRDELRIGKGKSADGLSKAHWISTLYGVQTPHTELVIFDMSRGFIRIASGVKRNGSCHYNLFHGYFFFQRGFLHQTGSGGWRRSKIWAWVNTRYHLLPGGGYSPTGPQWSVQIVLAKYICTIWRRFQLDCFVLDC